MKKQPQLEMESEDILDKEFSYSVKNTREKKAKKAQRRSDVIKVIRLVQITFMILATLLLVKQNFVYAIVLGVGVGLTGAETVFNLVFRNR